jgi:hypothetical protein
MGLMLVNDGNTPFVTIQQAAHLIGDHRSRRPSAQNQQVLHKSSPVNFVLFFTFRN